MYLPTFYETGNTKFIRVLATDLKFNILNPFLGVGRKTALHKLNDLQLQLSNFNNNNPN
jgi:hypothetical protein